MSTSSSPMTGGSSGEPGINFKPVDNSESQAALRALEKACKEAIRGYRPLGELTKVEWVRYSEGERGVVPIGQSEKEKLQPGEILGNKMVNDYISFVQNKLSPEHEKHLHLFNSRFSVKLSQSTTPNNTCKVNYEQMRRWTGEVNVFEKDYVFIPFLKRSHWSLVVICNLNSLTPSPDEMTRFPCVVHVVPTEGQHESYEGLIRSYVVQAWMERFQASRDKDQFRALCQMKYVQAKVPPGQYSRDCGVYVFICIIMFLVECIPKDFPFPPGLKFLPIERPKQRDIPNLVRGLCDLNQEHLRTAEEYLAYLHEKGEGSSSV